MPIKLITLNIEGDKHFLTVLPFLKQQNADIVCMQEVYEADLSIFKEQLGGSIYFSAINSMTLLQTQHAPRGPWGIAIWLRAGLASKQPITYFFSGSARQATHDNHPSHCPRAVMVTQCTLEGSTYTMANVHFTWTPDGEANDRQRADVQKLINILQPYPDVILCGDFNAPRGKEIFSTLSEHFTDNLPVEITSTLDSKLHRLQNREQLAVDTIFSTPEYAVSAVQVFEGISDHKALVASIEHSPL